MISYTVDFTCIQSLHVGRSNFGVGDGWHIFTTNIFTDKHETKWHKLKCIPYLSVKLFDMKMCHASPRCKYAHHIQTQAKLTVTFQPMKDVREREKGPYLSGHMRALL